MDSDNCNEISIKKENKTPIKKNPLKRKRTESENVSYKEESSSEEAERKSDFEDPHQDILSEVDHAFSRYTNYKHWRLARIPHHMLPSFNLTGSTSIDNVREFPLLKISLVRSVYVSSAVINDVDICHRRTLAMSSHMKRLKSARGAYHSTKKKSKQVRKDEKVGIYKNALFEFAKRNEFNPDKYFSRDYDFYYTSGNLCTHKETNRILHVEGNNMDRINLSEFSTENIIPKVVPIASTVVEANSELFEVKFSKSESNTFFTRQKHCVSVHQHLGEKRFRVLKKFESHEVPIISFDQDCVNTHHLAISDLDHNLRIYDMERGVPLKFIKPLKEETIEPSMRWNTIRSLDSHVYVYAACRKLNIIDTRIADSAWQSNYCSFDEESYCSSFCSLALSGYDNMFYVGSNHQVYCIDYRHMNKNIENKKTSVVRWTHHMRSYPLMMASSRHNNCEYVAAQSPVNTELRVFENIQHLAETDLSSEYIYKSPCLPYMPQSLVSVYHEARKHGKGINPNSGIVDRIKACNTGICFVGDNSNPFLLTATSNGDLFARHMSDDVYSQMFTAADTIGNFEENIYHSVKKPPLNVTGVYDLSGISKAFRCSALSDVKPDAESMAVEPKRRFMGRWQKSVRSLHKYKDALAPNLLSIWDIEMEDKALSLIGLSQSTMRDQDSLVSNWLNCTQEFANSTQLNMTSIPMDVVNSITTDHINTTLELTVNNENEVTVEETMTPISKPKVAKKKSRYVKGF